MKLKDLLEKYPEIEALIRDRGLIISLILRKSKPKDPRFDTMIERLKRMQQEKVTEENLGTIISEIEEEIRHLQQIREFIKDSSILLFEGDKYRRKYLKLVGDTLIITYEKDPETKAIL